MSEIRHELYSERWTHALEPGLRVVPHEHPYHLLVTASEGVLAVTTPAGTWAAPRNRAVWIPAGVTHGHVAHGRTVMRSVGFEPGERPVAGAEPVTLSVDELLGALIVAYTDDAGLGETELRHLRHVIGDRLARAPRLSLRLPRPRDARLAEACARVGDELPRAIPLAELARSAHASERTLSRLFQEELGMSYPRWRGQLRLYRAIVLLDEGMPVTAAGAACGWSSTSAFIAAYREAFGGTPGGQRDGRPARDGRTAMAVP